MNKDNSSVHIKQMAKKRFNIDLKQSDIDRVVQRILAGRCDKVLTDKKGNEHYLAVIEQQLVKVVFKPKFNILVTILYPTREQRLRYLRRYS